MQVFQGKSVFGGIAIGKISVYRKKEQQVRRRSVDDLEAEIGRYAWAVSYTHLDVYKRQSGWSGKRYCAI